MLDRIVSERRSSLAPNSLPVVGRRPHILVSEASVQVLDDFDDVTNAARRASTQSLGPVVVPEPGRRDSRGRLIDVPAQPRRSSFQEMCETAVQHLENLITSQVFQCFSSKLLSFLSDGVLRQRQQVSLVFQQQTGCVTRNDCNVVD